MTTPDDSSRVHTIIRLPFIALLWLSVGCTAPTDETPPEERCEIVCGNTASCGWADDIDFNQADCEKRCIGSYNEALELDCDAQWESALRCSQQKYTCAVPDEDPCKEENARFATCIE